MKNIDTTNSVKVVYGCDDAYALYTAVSIKSLIEHNSDLNLEIHLIAMNMSLEKIQIINDICNSVKIHKVESIESIIGQKYKNIEKKKTIYIKLFIDKILNEESKLLWIDSDTLICSSIEELYNTDLEGFVCGMVEDYGNYYKILNGYKKEDTYYNAGIILLDVKKWKEKEINNRVLEEINRRNGNSTDDWDQSYFNYILKNDIKGLPKKNNCLMQYVDSCKNPVIYHFAGKSDCKPWFSNYEWDYTVKDKWLNVLSSIKQGDNFQIQTVEYSIVIKIKKFIDKVIWKIVNNIPKCLIKPIVYFRYGFLIK